MDCKEVKNRIGELVDGEVTDLEREELLSHIAECEDCRREYEELQQLKKDFSRLNVQLKNALADSVMEKIYAEAYPQKKKSPVWVRYIGTAAALIIIAGVFFYTRLTPPRSDEKNAIQTESIETDGVFAPEETLDSDEESTNYVEDSLMQSVITTTPADTPMEMPEQVMEEPSAEEAPEPESKQESEMPKAEAPKAENYAEYTFASGDPTLLKYRYSNSVSLDTALIFVDGEVDDILPLFDSVEAVTDDTVHLSEPHDEVLDVLLSNSITVTAADTPVGSTVTTILTE